MFFCEVMSVARRLAVAAFVSLGFSAMAQQAIQFTKPLDKDPSDKANAFMPEDNGKQQ